MSDDVTDLSTRPGSADTGDEERRIEEGFVEPSARDEVSYHIPRD